MRTKTVHKIESNRDKGGRVVCPQCKHRTFYVLADGRRKCKKFGHKYTPFKKDYRLSSVQTRYLMRCLLRGESIENMAELMQLNRKTIMRYRDIIMSKYQSLDNFPCIH